MNLYFLKRFFFVWTCLLFLYGCESQNTGDKTPEESSSGEKVPAKDLVIVTDKTKLQFEPSSGNTTETVVENTDLAQEQTEIPPEVPDDQMVNIRDYIPSIEVDLQYASANNFTGEILYNFTEAELRYGTVKKLKKANDALMEQGFKIKVWDSFRPMDVQWRLWELYPDPVYVANPAMGLSDHTQGHTIDVTLVTLDGGDVDMPSKFDEFSLIADREYSDLSQAQRDNVLILETAMYNAGFDGYEGEWWHYSDTVFYPLIE